MSDPGENPLKSGFADPNVAQRVLGGGTDANPVDSQDTDSEDTGASKGDALGFLKPAAVISLVGVGSSLGTCSVIMGLPGITY